MQICTKLSPKYLRNISGRDRTAPRGSFAELSIGALGIVYGDIGTSPLYAMDQLFFGRAGAGNRRPMCLAAFRW